MLAAIIFVGLILIGLALHSTGRGRPLGEV